MPHPNMLPVKYLRVRLEHEEACGVGVGTQATCAQSSEPLSHMLCATGMVTICATFMPGIVIICHCDEKARPRASEEGHCLTHTV